VSNTIRGAVANWSKTLANELAVHGITVNNVLPGATETGRLEQIIQNKAAKTGAAAQEVKHEMESEVPMKRLAKPEEIAAAIAFLASPAAEAVNGQLFIVYGPTVTLVAAPTAEHRFHAAGQVWDPADLSASMQEYFADRDPERNFGVIGLMGD
jgi:NAD(P)-dependent dehydrogenase (short-subunit alcohol dehydrogenase family)